MRVFWWQGGLHLEPLTDVECVALQRLQEAFGGFGLVETSLEIHSSPVVEAHNEQAVVPVNVLLEVIP